MLGGESNRRERVTGSWQHLSDLQCHRQRENDLISQLVTLPVQLRDCGVVARNVSLDECQLVPLQVKEREEIRKEAKNKNYIQIIFFIFFCYDV